MFKSLLAKAQSTSLMFKDMSSFSKLFFTELIGGIFPVSKLAARLTSCMLEVLSRIGGMDALKKFLHKSSTAQ